MTVEIKKFIFSTNQKRDMSEHPLLSKVTNLEKHMIEESLRVRQKAYAPYSNFKVGAAILGSDDKVYTGCNVENVSYGLTICAERNTIFHMVSQGVNTIKAVVVSTETGTTPCGACRQVLQEFCGGNEVPIVMINSSTGKIIESTLRKLLPDPVEICKDLN